METIKRFVGYARVSTKGQGESGLGLEAQKQAIHKYLASLNPPVELLEPIHVEVESGRNNKRPELHKAMARCKETGATLVVAKIDRLTRDAGFLLSLRDSGIEFVACDMPTFNRFMIGIMALVAEQEADFISQRTKAGLEIARQRGRKLGGKRNDEQYAKSAAITKAAKESHAKEVYATIQDIQKMGVTTLEGIAAKLTQYKVATARKGQWTATAVRRVMLTMKEGVC